MNEFKQAKWWWDLAQKVLVRVWFHPDLGGKLYIYETASKRRRPSYYIKADSVNTPDVGPNTIAAGPFKTLATAKVAYMLMRGAYD